ncbi:BamA/TamA family outer membrane protein [Colwellia sp. TT2012]|uniref:BamA/TamA family outer membrane protein n=1 Tax=Colwellia sp. TT2012 TaxID=1720342 RepID=UPI0007097706|nr:BamA/TamA family outer membrane protein [Colwellia sp. TT2012]
MEHKINTLKKIATIFLTIGISQSAMAAEENSVTDKQPATEKVAVNSGLEANKLYLTPIPVIGYNPANGTIYGVGASASYYFGDPKTTKVSNMIAGLAKTSLGQSIFLFKSTGFTANNDWALLGDWRYLDTSQPTYGLGTGPDSSKLVTSGQEFEFDGDIFSGTYDKTQMMEFKYYRFYETALKRIHGDWYVGLGYHLDLYKDIQDNMLDLNAEEKVITSHYSYSQLNGFDPTGYTLSGLSLNVMFDSRDNAINPAKGQYALATYRYNAEFLGSDQKSSSLWLEYRKFHNLTPGKKYPDVLAFWAYGNFITSGDVPYMTLPATGYDQYARSGTGYVQGRFRGQDYAYVGVEYRKHLFNMWWDVPVGGVVQVNASTASATGLNDINLGQYIKPGYGIGLRFMLDKKTGTNVGIDFGRGADGASAMYVRLNENF